mmetsp:Transcript_7901/g.15446  ORF Transcript_7901/g.15446 Transcript_7901/m.15446 type:complete len:251 (+) Transcript_7901:55-807(+)|eukprot:CAMPEP_0167781808 /NCGR_PEP_ID=MMETSP0111_2-20121227/6147_1 /TAXON_ID=91324 /ORGANISM="Lotharella globosa, Strain CCCM811" /LENGTH=250 /DNA_ID=CAMNT_0007672529 /DNA_START=49 /DNA_END=801 /DNA_ORIENTATION=-
MHGKKMMASLAANAALALAIVGYIAYNSVSATNNLGAGMITRSPVRSAFRPSSLMMNSRRQLSPNAVLREPVADEYGTGLAQMAKEEGIVEKVQNDLKVWREVFKADPQAREFMYDPLANKAEKMGVVKDVVEKAGMQEYTANFLNLLLDMGRFEQLENIADVFDEEVMAMEGVKSVVVRSAVQLDDDAMFKIAEKVKKMSGAKSIQMKQELDESLLAGFVIDMDSQQIDMSLKNELETLKQNMLAPQMA